MALTARLNEGSVSRQGAIEIARLVLRDDAIKLYGRQAPVRLPRP